MSGSIEQRRHVLIKKPYLQALYREWYLLIKDALGSISGPILEVGSGPGFIDTVIANAVKSDIVFDRHLHIILDGTILPVASGKLGAIVGINVLHHVPHPQRFFHETVRCLEPGGSLVLIEPWNTPWAFFCMRQFHNEKFEPHASLWPAGKQVPVDDANNALAWIIFSREQQRFKDQYPQLRHISTTLLMPFSYLFSGGIQRISGAPGWAFPIVRAFECLCKPVLTQCAMFALILLRRDNHQ